MSKISELAKLYLPYVPDEKSVGTIKLLIQTAEKATTEDEIEKADRAVITAFLRVIEDMAKNKQYNNKDIKKLKLFVSDALNLLTHPAMIYNSENPFLNLPKEIFTHMKSVVPDEDMAKLISKLSQTNRASNSLFKEGFEDTYYQVLLQAVTDDNRQKVIKILNSKLSILSEPPKPNQIIQSKFTWQKFYAEDPLMMAVKRKQIEIIKILLPYYQKLGKNTEINTALSAWTIYKTKTIYNAVTKQNEEEIVIPQSYAIYAKQLLDTFTQEDVKANQLNNFSQPAEEALDDLYETLLPKKAIKLNDYLDVELFLLALYKAYNDHFAQFKNWEQREAFCVRVIGLVQSVLSPETAKIFCEGLYEVVINNKPISALAAALKLKDGQAYYRQAEEARSGAGYSFLVGGLMPFAQGGGKRRARLRGRLAFSSYVKQKQQLWKITQQLHQQPVQHSASESRSWCVIV